MLGGKHGGGTMPRFIKLTAAYDERASVFVNATNITHLFKDGTKTRVCFPGDDHAYADVSELPEEILAMLDDDDAHRT